MHQARGPKGPHGGTDCIGLLVGVARELGLRAEDSRTYAMTPSPEQLLERMSASCRRVSGTEPLRLRADAGAVDQVEPGRILLFFFSSPAKPQHAGIATPDGLLHTYAGADVREVEEVPWRLAWSRRLHSVWEYV